MEVNAQAQRSGGAARGAAVEPRTVVVTALTVVFGVQALRTLMPLLVFICRDRFGWSAASVGTVALVVYASGFAAAALHRLLDSRRFLLVTVGGVGLSRLALQLWTSDPLGDLVLAGLATSFFFLAVVALLADREGGASLALGWALGLACETVLHVLYNTWDMSWRSDVATAALVVLLVLVQLGVLVLRHRGAGAEVSDVAPSLSWTWLALGPLLFLELEIGGNVARLAALTGWPLEWASWWTMVGRFLALGAVVEWLRGRRTSWRFAAGLATVVVGSMIIPWPAGGLAVLQLQAFQITSALCSTILVVAIATAPALPGLRRLTLSHGIGLLFLAILFFLYYGSIDLRLPFPKEALRPVAAACIGLAAVGAARSLRLHPVMGSIAGRWWLVAASLLVLPAGQLMLAPQIKSSTMEQSAVRVMTFNIHCGIDPYGHLGLEAIAAAIETRDPDVVALQEVPRGWVINGSVDSLTWLSRRLEMPFVFAPTADPLWGNAILSRRPIRRHQTFELPTKELLIRRGFLVADLDLGDSGSLRTIATHFHHPRDGGAVRQQQSRAVLDVFQGSKRTVFAGDLNAEPDAPEIEMLRAGGLVDVGEHSGNTYSSWSPQKRIDYIWVSPDLDVSDVEVGAEQVSDHLPVSATVVLPP